MTKLSSAAWVAHDLGLATAIGGSLFSKTAMDPAIRQLRNEKWRDQVNAEAWDRYGPVSMGAHAAIVLPWLVGRVMLSGREVSATARKLTLAKDILIGVSAVSLAATALLGKLLTRRQERGKAAAERGEAGPGARGKRVLDAAVDVVSTVNLAANLGVLGVTAVLAMEAGQSGRFSVESRTLP